MSQIKFMDADSCGPANLFIHKCFIKNQSIELILEICIVI